MKSKESERIIIYSKRIAIELRKRGFKILATGVNQARPQFDTYIFENSPELQDALNELM